MTRDDRRFAAPLGRRVYGTIQWREYVALPKEDPFEGMQAALAGKLPTDKLEGEPGDLTAKPIMGHHGSNAGRAAPTGERKDSMIGADHDKVGLPGSQETEAKRTVALEIVPPAAAPQPTRKSKSKR